MKDLSPAQIQLLIIAFDSLEDDTMVNYPEVFDDEVVNYDSIQAILEEEGIKHNLRMPSHWGK